MFKRVILMHIGQLNIRYIFINFEFQLVFLISKIARIQRNANYIIICASGITAAYLFPLVSSKKKIEMK